MITHKLKPFLLWTLDQFDIPLDVIRWEIFTYFEESESFWEFLKICYDEKYNQLLKWGIKNIDHWSKFIHEFYDYDFDRGYNDIVKQIILRYHEHNTVSLNDSREIFWSLYEICDREISMWYSDTDMTGNQWCIEGDQKMIKRMAGQYDVEMSEWLADKLVYHICVGSTLYVDVGLSIH